MLKRNFDRLQVSIVGAYDTKIVLQQGLRVCKCFNISFTIVGDVSWNFLVFSSNLGTKTVLMIKTNLTFFFNNKKFQEDIGVVTVAQSVERLSADWPIDLVTVFDAILTSRQTLEKLYSDCMNI